VTEALGPCLGRRDPEPGIGNFRVEGKNVQGEVTEALRPGLEPCIGNEGAREVYVEVTDALGPSHPVAAKASSPASVTEAWWKFKWR